ncbi:MAG: FGGY-family carbohydrate kinase [Clostridia bacterium]|nr:FGGY-family carbohydrate kinase [Clostridia bacterium]
MEFFIGLDIGTTAIKGVLMSAEGRIIKTVSGGYNYYCEGDKKLLKPADFIGTCFSVISSLASYKGDGGIKAICSCCASGNLILLDNDDKPVTPIVGWQTTVSEEDKNAFFTPEEQAAFYKTVGWPLGSRFPALYLAAINLHEPKLLKQTKTVAMSAEYLNFMLTGKWGISVSMGTPSFLMDQEKGEYNYPLLKKLGIADKCLPPVYDKGTVLGGVLPEVAKKLNLSDDTKVVLGSFDHPSGATGAGVFGENEMLLSCGTSWVEFFPVKSREFAVSTRGLIDRFMINGTPYCVMKSITSVSEKIDALRRHFFGEISHKEFDTLAARASLGCGGLRFDFSSDDDYKKAFAYAGSDIARAIIESAAYILKENLETLEKCGLKAKKITMIGGISNSADCVRIISEVLDMPVKVVNGQCAGAVGSALLAGIGAGVYKDEKDAFSRFEVTNK